MTAGKVFPLPDGQHLLTARGVLLTASPAPQAVDDLRPVRDLGLGAVVAALSMPDRGLHGLIQWTGWLTNSLVFLREDWQTELVRLSVDHEARELARYDDRFFLAGSTKTHTWVEQHRIPARFAEEDLAPEVSLLAPEAGTVVLLGSTVELRAEVRDEDGIVTRVRFLSANEELGELLVPPYVLNWQPAAPGEYLISAIATDNLGVSTRTAPARLIVNAPPTISLSDPNAGGPLVSPASFILEAEAHDPEGAIGEVEFRYLPHREAPVRLGVVSTAPYRWELVDFMGTDGHVEAVVRDDYGASAEATRPLRLLGPVGDDLRRPLALPPLGGVVQTNNVTATKQLEETQRFWFDPAPEHSLWWAWTSPGDGVLRCSTRGSSFDAQLLIFMGTNAPTLELVAWSRDLIPHSLTKELKVAVSAQTSYLIGVASARADAAGLIRLEAAFLPVVSEPGPAPPTIGGRMPFPDRLPGLGDRHQQGATGAASHPGSGSVIADPWPAVWWTWTAPRAGSYRLSTRGSDFDTRLGVAYEVRPGVLTNLGGNDDEHPATLTSQYRLQAVQGRAYYLVVDGFAGATGNITLSIERPDELGAPGNDDFANRGQLQGSLALVAGTTFGATFEAGEPTQILTNTPAGRLHGLVLLDRPARRLGAGDGPARWSLVADEPHGAPRPCARGALAGRARAARFPGVVLRCGRALVGVRRGDVLPAVEFQQRHRLPRGGQRHVR
ncbi:MAG: Ig-like domain-containing protein [Verrucomicrobia bacterium]|nr:Ig-like domain-containing protein [Verrucomicrobiota bacterium]